MSSHVFRAVSRLRLGSKRTKHLLDAISLGDPVGRRSEDEEDADEHLDRAARHFDAGLDELVARGQFGEAPLEPGQYVVLQPSRL